MKRILLLLLLLSENNFLSAQKPGIDVELNSFRWGGEVGPIGFDYFYFNSQLLPDISVGITFKDKHRTFVKGRRLPSEIKSSTGFGGEVISLKGIDLSMGYERIVFMNKRFTFLPALSLFYDYARLNGYAFADHPYNVEINNKRHFYGIAPEMKFGFALTKKLQIIVGHKARLGYINSISLPPTRPRFSEFGGDKGFYATVDFLSSVALRYRFN